MGTQLIPEHEHIADLDAVLVAWFTIIPEIVMPNVVHSQATFLVKGYIGNAAVGCADKQSLFPSPPPFINEPRDKLAAKALPVMLRGDRQLHDLTGVTAPLHCCCTD